MKHEHREFSNAALPSAGRASGIKQSSRSLRYERPPTATSATKRCTLEENRRLLLENDMSNAHENGLRVCRLWQLLLTLNITIILITIILVTLLLFIIGPLFPYQTFGQSCRAASCNRAQGLICSTQSICLCPSPDSYWSYNETRCRVCPAEWSFVNGKCIFVSTFYLNWTDAFAYCKSFTAQLLTLSPAKVYSSLTLSQVNNSVSSNTNYFIGLSEQPDDSGNWQWVDGSSLLPSTMTLFCVNGTVNYFDSFFRTNMDCGIYRMDACLARCVCQRVDMNFLCEKI